MCFSAGASFIVSAGLSVIGVASIRKVKTPNQYSFASIPLVFAVQQFIEGLVWVSLGHEGWSKYTLPASIVFLLFAQVVWPIWMPVSFLRLEREARRKRILRIFVLPGVIVALYFLYCLFTFKVETMAANHHVFYNLDFPGKLVPYAAGFYLVATVVPPLLSKYLKIKLMGLVLLGSYIVARLFFQPSLISVWCFFALAVAVLVYFVMLDATANAKEGISNQG